MPDYSMYSLEAAVREANVVRLSIADSGATPSPLVGKIRLFDAPFTPNWNTVKADMVAAETALVVYPVVGYDVEDMLPPAQVSGGGVVITTPTVNVAYASGAGVAISGGWLEDDAGNVRQIYVFDPVKTVSAPADAFLIIKQMGYGRNP